MLKKPRIASIPRYARNVEYRCNGLLKNHTKMRWKIIICPNAMNSRMRNTGILTSAINGLTVTLTTELRNEERYDISTLRFAMNGTNGLIPVPGSIH